MQNRKKISESQYHLKEGQSILLGTSILEENEFGSSLARISPSEKFLPDSPKNFNFDRMERRGKMLDSEEDLRFLQFDDYNQKPFLSDAQNHIESPDESLEILSEVLCQKNSASRLNGSNYEDFDPESPDSHPFKPEAVASPELHQSVSKDAALQQIHTKQNLSNFLKRISSTDQAGDLEFSPYSPQPIVVTHRTAASPLQTIKGSVEPQKPQALPAWLQTLRQNKLQPANNTQRKPSAGRRSPDKRQSHSQLQDEQLIHKRARNSKSRQPRPSDDNRSTSRKAVEIQSPESKSRSRKGHDAIVASTKQPLSLTGIAQVRVEQQPTNGCSFVGLSLIIPQNDEPGHILQSKDTKSQNKLKHSDSRIGEKILTDSTVLANPVTSARLITPTQQDNLRRLAQLPSTSNSRKPVSLSQVLGTGREENHARLSHIESSGITSGQAQNKHRLLNSTSATGLNRLSAGGTLLKKTEGSRTKDSTRLPRTSSKKSSTQAIQHDKTKELTSESQIGEFTMHLHAAKTIRSKAAKATQPTGAVPAANPSKSKSKSKSKTKQIQRKTSGAKFISKSPSDEEDFLPSFGEALRQKKTAGPSKLEVLTSTAEHSGSQPEEGSSPPHLRLSASSTSMKSPNKPPGGFPQVFALESPTKEQKMRPSASRDEYLLSSGPLTDSGLGTVRCKNSKPSRLELFVSSTNGASNTQSQGNGSHLNCRSPPKTKISRVMEMASPPKAKERTFGSNTLMSIISKHLQ